MLLIISPFTNAAINLALEELYFKERKGDICFIYRNSPSVIIGKHQNIFKEVNLPFCIKNNVGYYRRISGGGTVFHDLGNLNISLHTTRNDDYKVNYLPLLNLIQDAVKKFGIDLSLGKRNDLYLGNKKITGTACHVVRDRTIHHGTLLYNTKKELLHHCLSQPLEFSGRSVESVRSEVTNIYDHLTKKLSTEEFISEFIVHLSDILDAYIDYPSDQDVVKSEKLAAEKYTLDSWNIDYSPSFNVEYLIHDTPIKIYVEKGEIIAIQPLKDNLEKWLKKPFKHFLTQHENYGI